MFNLLWHIAFVALPFLGLVLGHEVFFPSAETREDKYLESLPKRFVIATVVMLVLAGNMYSVPSLNVVFIGERHETRMLLGTFLGPVLYVVSLLVNGVLKIVSRSTI